MQSIFVIAQYLEFYLFRLRNEMLSEALAKQREKTDAATQCCFLARLEVLVLYRVADYGSVHDRVPHPLGRRQCTPPLWLEFMMDSSSKLSALDAASLEDYTMFAFTFDVFSICFGRCFAQFRSHLSITLM